MASAKIEIETQDFASRVNRVYEHWKQHKQGDVWNNADSVVITVGKLDEEVVYRKSNSVHFWLFGYESPETIILFTATAVKILTSSKKAATLQVLKNEKLANATLEIIARDPKDDSKEIKQLIESMQKSHEGKTYGTFIKEKPSGAFAESWLKELQNSGLNQIDVTHAFAELFAIKDQKEQKNIRTAATVSSHMLKSQLLREIEIIIDEEKKVKHSELADKMEKIFEDPATISKKLSRDHLDSCYTPRIQSGGNYDLRPESVNDDNYLSFDTIICSLGAKFKSYCSNISRTYLVDPKPEQKEIYQLLFDIQQWVISRVKPGVKLNKIMNEALNMISTTKPEIVDKFSKSCGYGIGLEFRESDYTINTKNERTFENGMVFNISVGFDKLELAGSTKTYSLLLADTILIKPEGVEVLTDKCPKKPDDIIYYLETEEPKANDKPAARVKEEEKPKPKPKPKPAPTRVSDTISTMVESKFRESTVQRKEEKNKLKEAEEKRREHQKQLEEKLKEEAMSRFSKGKKKDDKQGKKEKRTIEAYKDVSEYPKELDKQRDGIYIDTVRETIFVSIYGYMVPFHISNIKTASKTDEEYLRINFITPDATIIGNKANEMVQNPTAIRIKEITYRCPNEKDLNNALRMIKELRKRVTAKETERREAATLIEQEKLVLSKGRNPRLSDVFIRPNPVGRRTTGILEAHTNGFRFTLLKGESIDIMYKNIKRAFFQPAEKELIVLVHFHLHNAIMVGKKKTTDIQFCTEVMEVSQSLDGRKYDADEIEDEQRERQMRAKLNSEFQNFVRKVEDAGYLDFDMPYRDLGFYGVPHRSSVFLQPTVHSLISLAETPFFVLNLEDVELAYFERVQFSLRNFDLVFIFKDYDKPVAHINSIPVEYLDTIKEWLDQCDIKYYEGTQTLNWSRIMATIQDDPVKFHADGGWSFLSTESDSEKEEDPEELESDFEPEAKEETFEEEDDDDDEDDYGSAEDDDDEMMSEEDEEDEDGEDWDALEEKAKNEDKQRAAKRERRGKDGEVYSDDSDDDRKKKSQKKR